MRFKQMQEEGCGRDTNRTRLHFDTLTKIFYFIFEGFLVFYQGLLAGGKTRGAACRQQDAKQRLAPKSRGAYNDAIFLYKIEFYHISLY